MTTEQRRALANTTPTTDAIRDAVTFPRDRLGEPLDISPERFEAWLARVRRDAAREALDGLADEVTHVDWDLDGPAFALRVRRFKTRNYPEETP